MYKNIYFIIVSCLFNKIYIFNIKTQNDILKQIRYQYINYKNKIKIKTKNIDI